MTKITIFQLSNSSELVFRAKFEDKKPGAPYYWRSMVHEVFSDQTWKITNKAKTTASKPVINYDSKIVYVKSTYDIVYNIYY